MTRQQVVLNEQLVFHSKIMTNSYTNVSDFKVNVLISIANCLHFHYKGTNSVANVLNFCCLDYRLVDEGAI